MSLATVIAAIQSDMTAAGVVLSQPITLDRLDVAKNGTPPRIVCVPTSDTFSGPKQAGGDAPSRATRVCGCDAHIWGATLASTDALIEAFSLALTHVATNYSLGTGTWSNNAGHETNGHEYVLAFKVETAAALEPTARRVAIRKFVVTDKIQAVDTGLKQYIPPT